MEWSGQIFIKETKLFVAKRAAEILKNSSLDQWIYVKGVQNPADMGTPGLIIEGLRECGWLGTPAWFHKYEEDWSKLWCKKNDVEPEQAASNVQ